MLVLLIVLFVALLLAGVPIAAAMGLPAIAYFLIQGIPLSTATYSMFQTLNSFTMIAVPMFILMGTMVNAFGETDRVFHFARLLLRNKRGYSAKLNVIISLIFAGISGAALADIGGLGQMEIKAMEDEGYSREYGAALTIATATIGPIFPPSIPMVIFAMVAQVSSVKALLAGVVPGVVLTIALFFYVSVTDRRNLGPAKQAPPPIQPGELRRSFFQAIWLLLAAPAIVAAMLFGVFSPGEAGAMGVLYLLMVGLMHKEASWRKIYASLKETLFSISSILLVVASGSIFTKALTMEKLPLLVTSALTGFTSSKVVILLVINLVLIILGLFMESISTMILMTPILTAIGATIGVDPIHMGIILVFNLMIGMTTPPFGMSLYAVAKVGKITPEGVIRQMVPLYGILLIALLVVTFVPALSTWLPNYIFQ